jgi:hypothetical protein
VDFVRGKYYSTGLFCGCDWGFQDEGAEFGAEDLRALQDCASQGGGTGSLQQPPSQTKARLRKEIHAEIARC